MALQPRAHTAHNLGLVFDQLGDWHAAVRMMEHALRLDPNLLEATAQLAFGKRRLCDWAGIDALGERLRRAVDNGAAGVTPFSFLAEDATPAQQLNCARLFARQFAVGPRPASAVAGARRRRRAARRFRFVGIQSSRDRTADRRDDRASARLAAAHDRVRHDRRRRHADAQPPRRGIRRIPRRRHADAARDSGAHPRGARRHPHRPRRLLHGLAAAGIRAAPRCAADQLARLPGLARRAVLRLPDRGSIPDPRRAARALRREHRVPAALLPTDRHDAVRRRRAAARGLRPARGRDSSTAASTTPGSSRRAASLRGCASSTPCRAACCGCSTDRPATASRIACARPRARTASPPNDSCSAPSSSMANTSRACAAPTSSSTPRRTTRTRPRRTRSTRAAPC